MEEDKIEAEIEKYGSNVRRTKIWYNDVLVWNIEKDNDSGYFEIVK